MNRLRACQTAVRKDPELIESELEGITRSLKGHVQDIRRLIYDLRPLAIDQLGLEGAVQQQVERFSKGTGIHAFASVAGEIPPDSLAEVTVFRVLQECLRNVQKHSNATQVEVRLEGTESGLELTVQDNGQGFNPDVVSGRTAGGVGVLSMRERAELVGGHVTVESSPGNGCQVVLHVPGKEAEVGAHSNPVG